MSQRMLKKISKTISRYQMLEPGRRVIAAVSGGADSVCLLHILREIGADIAGVAHFNHKLRGQASDEDEQFVAAMAGHMGLSFYRAEGSAIEGNLEQAARRARREFFSQLIREGKADCVALGHTRDDQAETVLFRVLRGSGLTGLAGIHPVARLVNEGDGLIRPLIDVTRVEIEEYLRSNGIAWREDASNSDPRFARNRIRHQLLPQLAHEWNPRIAEALANLADLAYEEERAARGQKTEVRRQNKAAVELSVNELTGFPRAMARRVVRNAIETVKGDLRGIEFQHVERVIDMRAGRIRLPGIEAIRSFDWIRIARVKPPESVPALEVAVPGIYATPDGLGRIQIEACANLKLKVAVPLILRGWRAGDHYRPAGKSRDHKLKEMFQEARVPLWQRRFWPILESEGKIFWAKRFGPAEGVPLRISETFPPSDS